MELMLYPDSTRKGGSLCWLTTLSKAYSTLEPSQWETSLQSNAVSHWLAAIPVPPSHHKPVNMTTFLLELIHFSYTSHIMNPHKAKRILSQHIKDEYNTNDFFRHFEIHLYFFNRTGACSNACSEGFYCQHWFRWWIGTAHTSDKPLPVPVTTRFTDSCRFTCVTEHQRVNNDTLSMSMDTGHEIPET